MIKKYNQYIKENNIVYSSDEIDPYGEEDWDEVELTPVLRIAKKHKNSYKQLTYLRCRNKGLITLEGIENLVNLELLYCSDNHLTNLKGIENLVNLRFLDCSYNNLTSLKGIENLVNLIELICFDNNLTSLEGIESLINLQILYCFDNNFSDDYTQYLIDYCTKKKIDLYL